MTKKQEITENMQLDIILPDLKEVELQKDVSKQSIHTTINLVMQDLSKKGIGKDRTNEMQRYKYRGIDDLYDTVASIYAKHGLIIYPQVIDYKHESRPTKTGVANYVLQQVKFIFCHIYNEQSFETIVWGEALDNSDKATNKSLTSAYKYMAIMTFSIPINGDSNDSDNSTPETIQTSYDQLLGLFQIKKIILTDEQKSKVQEAINTRDKIKIEKCIKFLQDK